MNKNEILICQSFFSKAENVDCSKCSEPSVISYRQGYRSLTAVVLTAPDQRISESSQIKLLKTHIES